mgnify:CR=1 FL=1
MASNAIATLAEVSGILGTIAKFFRVLLGAGVSWEQFRLVIDDRKARRNLAEYLKLGCPRFSDALNRFPVWRTIRIGTHKSVDDLKKAVIEAGRQIGNWANNIFGQAAFTLSAKEEDVDLVVASVAELGLQDGATTKQIFDRIKELGDLCSAEDGPQLTRQYKDQPLSEILRMAMEPIAVSDGFLYVFRVEHDEDGLWLDADGAHPSHQWRAVSRWVFRRRK